MKSISRSKSLSKNNLTKKKWILSLSDVRVGIMISFRIKITTLKAKWRLWSTFYNPNKTSLHRFILAVEGDIKALKKPLWITTKNMLSESMDNLFEAFCNLSGSDMYKNILQEKIEYLSMMLNIIQLEKYIKIHNITGNYMEEIRKLTFRNDVKEASGMLKLWVNKLESIWNSVNDESEKTGSNINDLIAGVGSHQHHRISLRDETVSSFASMVKRYTSYLKYLEEKQNKNGK